MKLPGRAWLEFEVTGDSRGSTIRQTATFDPGGVVGTVLLVCRILNRCTNSWFQGMLRGIAGAIDRAAAGW